LGAHPDRLGRDALPAEDGRPLAVRARPPVLSGLRGLGDLDVDVVVRALDVGERDRRVVHGAGRRVGELALDDLAVHEVHGAVAAVHVGLADLGERALGVLRDPRGGGGEGRARPGGAPGWGRRAQCARGREDDRTGGGTAHGAPWGGCGYVRLDPRRSRPREASPRDGDRSPSGLPCALSRPAYGAGTLDPGRRGRPPIGSRRTRGVRAAARVPTMLDEVRSPHVRIGVPREVRDGERLVAATPRTVERLRALGYEVVVEHDAGAGATFSDAAYEAAGATVGDAATAWGADVVTAVNAPTDAQVALLRPGAALVAMLGPANDPGLVQR